MRIIPWHLGQAEGAGFRHSRALWSADRPLDCEGGVRRLQAPWPNLREFGGAGFVLVSEGCPAAVEVLFERPFTVSPTDSLIIISDFRWP